MRAALDFNDYPDITSGDIRWSPPPDSLNKIPELYARAISSLNMLFSISKYAEREGYTPEIHAASHIRLSLVEFVAIEEVMQSSGYSNFKITNSTSPLLHFMRLLRNYNVHIGSPVINKSVIDVEVFEQKWEMPVAIIDNLSVNQFMSLRAIAHQKLYTQEELEKMISLFNEQQARLGVYEILKCGVERLIREVENAF